MNIFISLMLISTILSVVIFVYVVLRRNFDRSIFLIFSSVASFFYTLGYLFEITSLTAEAALMGVKIQKIGSLLVILLFYLFIRDVYGRRRFCAQTYLLLFTIPLINLFSALTYPLVKLHYTKTEFFQSGSIVNIHGYPGVVNYIGIVYNFVFIFLSIYTISKYLKSESKLQRKQSVLLLLAILVPFIVNVYHTLSYNKLRIDLNPLAIFVSLMLLIYSIQMQNLLNVVPLAREQVIESMSDAFIVCDKDFIFLDANQAAKKLFPELATLLPGESMNHVKNFKTEGELALLIDDQVRFFQISQTCILRNSKEGGICIVIYDITDKEHQLLKLYGKATFDSLMLIYNRATFFDLANLTLNTNQALNHEYGFLMIDLDHFKVVNDTYGHLSGDFVLKTIAMIIKDHFKANDIVGRYGGEEIVVLLENISEEKLLFVVEKLRGKIENTVISYEGNDLKITVSIGMSHSPKGANHSLNNMLMHADSALYRVKHSGRNNIWLDK